MKNQKAESRKQKCVESASEHPCKDCPWRLANQGKAHPGRWYAPANLKRLWNGLRRGRDMTCHPTDDRMNEFPWRPVPDGATPHECAGALILKQREFMKFQRLCLAHPKSNLRDYRKANPAGLTRDALADVAARHLFGGVPIVGGLPMAKVNLNDAEIGYPPLPWDFPAA